MKAKIDSLPTNNLCQRCRKKCKQPAYMVLIKCPHFEAQAVQLEIPLGIKTRSRKFRPDNQQ